MQLNDPGLFRQQCLVNGLWRDAASSARMVISNPADGAVLGTVPELSAEETRAAIEAAHGALPRWRKRTAKERAAILKRWSGLLLENIADLARIMTAEQGKPLAEARSEITGAAGFIEWFAEEGKRAYGEIVPAAAPDRRTVVLKEPIGVVAAITPWNFPSSMIARKCAPALAAGCTIVVKPAPQTPFSALALAALAERAGVPAGALNVITGDAGTIGPQLTSHPKVRKLSFTGSTRVGKMLMAQCADTVKRVSLELGGHAPFIVFDDAEIETAVAQLMLAKFRNAGQACVGANRIYVQEPIYDRFLERLTAAVAALKVGNGLEEGVTQGPLISAAAVTKVETHISDAVDKGARVLAGGCRHSLGGTFFEPTVLADVTDDMLTACEETFGPVASVLKFATEEEVFARANNTPYGLSSYVFTRDIGRVWRAAESLEAGIVGINVGVTASESAPFGGVKESGIGREGSKHGLEEFLEIKYICIGGLAS
ncbi:MAG TPA: NAD-dependent succinate-semialdehyde dehydrogenase [Hyphomicrobiaceae bacterium]